MSDGLLDQTPEAAVGQIAIELLDAARQALDHLLDGSDPEALHDFRVAIRRLRSTADAWKRPLRDRLTKKDRRTLRALQRMTGGARDAEVALAWLDGLPSPIDAHVAGYEALRARLTARLTPDSDGVWTELVEVFDALDQRLRSALADVPEADRLFGPDLAVATAAHARRLRKGLRRARKGDPNEGHRARIRCKRLRYLVEPAVGFAEGANVVVKSCKRLQDTLGDMNDAHVLSEDVASAMGDDPEAPEHAGLEAAITLARERHMAAFDRFCVWVDEQLPGFTRATADLVRELQLSAASVEIERKYLLTGMPQIPEPSRTREIQQGYLPLSSDDSQGTDDTEERVRSILEGEEIRYVRTLKRGSGVARQELEEFIDAKRFKTLWPRTKGRRVHKRRHVVAADGLVWEIDQFLDRDLVLAEIELPHVHDTVNPPAWLAPFVAREVTEDRGFANANLAR